MGLRVPLGPPVVLETPPPEVMRRLPTDTALYIAMTCLGHGGPGYRMGKTLAHNRRRIEEVWAKPTRSKA